MKAQWTDAAVLWNAKRILLWGLLINEKFIQTTVTREVSSVIPYSISLIPLYLHIPNIKYQQT